MPTEVKTKPPDSFPPKSRGTDKYSEHDQKAAANKVKQQQQQHREALRLALGSILSPRPPLNSSHSSSGSTTPSYPFSIPSGAHTPTGTPPSYYPLAHGPNSSEYIHSHHPHFHHSHPHTHTPSRLGRSKSSTTNSPSGSSAPSSSHPSPLPPSVPINLPILPEIEPLPPAQVTNGVIVTTAAPLPTRPPNSVLQPSDHTDSADHAARTGTPRSKFMQTLQSKSAWDALIHGSFS